MTEGLVRAVETFFARASALHFGDCLLVGVSGGVDSVSLLHALRAAPGLSVDLHVAHLDHRLRGAESAADAQFVKNLAGEWGLPVTVEAADVAAYASSLHLSLEAAARAVRYAFFARLAERLGATAVVVGHNADDQVETLLLHLIRGTGLAGLRGMRPVQRLSAYVPGRAGGAMGNGQGDLLVLRPFLSVPRREIVAYARRHSLPYRDDASNDQRVHLRNRVRHELVPLLETLNPGFRDLAHRTTGLLAADFEYLCEAAATALERCASFEEATVRLRLGALLEEPLAIRRLLVREAYARLVGDTTDLAAGHVEDVLALAERGRTGAVLALPGKVKAIRTYGDLMLASAIPERQALPAVGVKLNVPGLTSVEPGSLCIEATFAEQRCHGGEGNGLHVDLDLARAGGDLYVRRRLPGDRLRPLGLGGSKKVQDILVDAKVPRWERDAVPVLATAGRVIWLAGYALDEGVRVRNDTKRVLCLRVHKKGSK